MRKLIFLTVTLFCLQIMFGQASFTENKGQLIDFNKQIINDIVYYSQGSYDVYFRNNGVSYVFKKSAFNDENYTKGVLDKLDPHKKIREYVVEHKQDSTYYYRLDMNFVNPNPNLKMVGGLEENSFSNYYYAHCPEGILNVKEFKKIIYQDVYPGTSIEFYFTEGKLKYDIILEPGADLNRIKFEFPGIENIKLVNNQFSILTKVGEIQESLPKSYTLSESKETSVNVEYQVVNNIISFNADYNKTQKLIIDPQIVWQTFYQQSFGIGLDNAIDSKGNQLVNVGYTFNASFPTLNPGGGAYFQNTIAGSGDIRLVQFDTNGIRQWSTYYGGTDYEHSADVVIDFSDNIVVCLQTESNDIPLQNAGGYYDATYTSGTYNWASTFILRFNSSGVRNWGTHYDHFQYPQIEVDGGNNYILVGQSQYDNPPVQALGGAYNQATVSLDGAGTSSSGDLFIAKFNSSTSRVWATNLGSTSREMIGKITIDRTNNLYIWGAGDNYYGTGIVTLNAGGYFDNQLGIGTGGSAADRGDCILYKFSSTGALLWGTAFGGSGFEWAWGSQSAITTDNYNNVYVMCVTTSTDLPLLDPGSGAYYDATFNNSTNHFITKFNNLTQLQWCSYWGNYSASHATSHGVELEFNELGNLTIAVGAVNGNHYPLLNRPTSFYQNYQSGDVHIGELNTSLSLVWGTYYGGLGDERLSDIDFLDFSNSFFMTNSWQSGSGALWISPPAGAYYDGAYVSSSGLISKFSTIICDSASNTTDTSGICEGTNKTLIGAPSGGTWTIISGPGSIVGTTYSSGNIVTDQLVTIRYEINAPGCPDTIADVSFTVFASPSPALNTTSTDSICETGSKLLTGTPSGGTWSIISGGGNIVGTTYNPPNISSTTSVTIRYTIDSNGQCPGSFNDVMFNVEPDTNALITNSAAAMCVGDTRVLTGVPVGGVWSLTGPGNIVGTTLTSTGTGTIQVVYTFSNACGSVADTQNIMVVSVVSPAITNSTSAMCINDKRALSATPTGGTWSVISGTGTIGSNDTLIANGAGTIQVRYAVSSSCGSGADTITILVNPLPVANAGLSQTICLGDSIILMATGGGTYNWSNGAITDTTTVSPPSTTTYIVTITSAVGCVASDSVTVTIQLTGNANAQDDIDSLITGETKNINVYYNDVGDLNSINILVGPNHGSVSLSGGILTYTSTLGFTGIDSLQYKICDPNCTSLCDTAWVYILVDIGLRIPNAISPNGDGKNDFFNILGLNKYPDNELQIFNRWGSLIYHVKPYQNDWYGQNNQKSILGDKVVSGTYFYILKLGEGLDAHTGYIEVKR